MLREFTLEAYAVTFTPLPELHDLNVYVSKMSNVTSSEDKCAVLAGEAQTTEVRLACSQAKHGRYDLNI